MPPHVFHEGQKERLVGEERQKMQPAEDILRRSGMVNGSRIADLGCGNGYLSVPLLKAGAHVFALDTQREMLLDLMKRAGADGERVRPILSSLPDIPMKDMSMDHIFMVNIFHELDNKDILVNECRRVLKTDGRLTLVDFQKRQTEMGPPMEVRLAEDEVEPMFQGFQVERRFSLPSFYQFEFRPTSLR
jgi:ubiquinone/menaquinone biosynthesis C-methylase UbiE